MLIIQLIGLFVFLFVFFMFCVEAWHVSAGQGICCTLIPCYVFYFAFIHSRRAALYRYLLMVSICLMFVAPIAAKVFAVAGAAK